MEEKVAMELKNSFSNHWLMVRLTLSLRDLRIWKKLHLLKKGILNLAYKQGSSLEKSKEPDKFRASKSRK